MPQREPDEQRTAWKPRSRRDGQAPFVSIPDDLYLAMIGTTALDAVVRVIVYQERAESWKPWATSPVRISIDEFVGRTGLSPASVHRALAKGRELGMIEVSTGGGRGRRSAYSVTPPSTWTHIKGVTSETLSTHQRHPLDPERVSSPNSERASPLRTPLRDTDREGESLREGQSPPEAERVETVSTKKARSSPGRAGDEGHARRDTAPAQDDAQVATFGSLSDAVWKEVAWFSHISDWPVEALLTNSDDCRRSVEGDKLVLWIRRAAQRQRVRPYLSVLRETLRARTGLADVELRLMGAAS